jgi:uncharacterized phage-like protein YoqJ
MGGRFERTEQYIIQDTELEFEYDENKSASNKNMELILKKRRRSGVI